MQEQLTAVFQQVSEGISGSLRIARSECPSAILEEARSHLRQAVQLVLEANRTLAEEDLRDKSVIREPFAQIS